MGHKRADLVGRQFGHLKVIAFADLDLRRNSRWLCVCECGTQKVLIGHHLTRGHHVSCGCRMQRRTETHVEDHPDFRVFCGMLSRCCNPNNPMYPQYGGRGIVVCERWREGGFKVFIEDMGPRSSPDHSIDRIDNDGPYTPENCRWATAKEQGRNRRTNVRLTWRGETLTMSEWAERTGVDYRTLKARLYQGWPLERALNPELTVRGITPAQRTAILAARAAGLTMQKAAEKVGVGIATVHKVCTGKDYKKSRPGLPPPARSAPDA